jgi:hypothetical protein
LFDFLTKRKAAEQGKIPAPQTEQLPMPFRRQVERILVQTIGEQRGFSYNDFGFPPNQAWHTIHVEIAQEHGLPYLGKQRSGPMHGCLEYLLNADTDEALDLIGVALQYIERYIETYGRPYQFIAETSQTPAEAIREFNERCRQHGVGYQYESGRLIPSSSAYIHSQIVQPALVLVARKEFSGAQAEFLRAHEHLRAGEHEAAIVAAARAFESAMKTICALKKWKYPAESQVKQLVPILFDNGLVPPYMQDHFNNLKAILISVATPRNKDAAHGREYKPVDPPHELAEFAIHLTGVAIVFLVERYNKSWRLEAIG